MQTSCFTKNPTVNFIYCETKKKKNNKKGKENQITCRPHRLPAVFVRDFPMRTFFCMRHYACTNEEESIWNKIANPKVHRNWQFHDAHQNCFNLSEASGHSSLERYLDTTIQVGIWLGAISFLLSFFLSCFLSLFHFFLFLSFFLPCCLFSCSFLYPLSFFFYSFFFFLWIWFISVLLYFFVLVAVFVFLSFSYFISFLCFYIYLILECDMLYQCHEDTKLHNMKFVPTCIHTGTHCTTWSQAVIMESFNRESLHVDKRDVTRTDAVR